MSIEVRVPQLPESVEDATVATWHKKPGEHVALGENIVDLETDKVMLEVPSPISGILGEAKISEGTTVKPGDVVAILQEDGEAAAAPAPAAAAAQPAPRSNGEAAKAPPAPETPQPAPMEALSPAVRRLIEEHQLDPTQIPGSGRDGRLTKEDVLHFIQQQEAKSAAKAAPAAARPAPSPQPQPQPQPQGPEISEVELPTERGRLEQRVPMTRLRARIAERLVQAQHEAAMLTTFNEINLYAVNQLRARYREQFEKEHGIRLGLMSFFVKATVEALKRFPVINASIDGSDVVYHDYFDIGIAVASPRGLLVPILRDVDQLSFAQVEKSIREYGEKARDGKLTLEDLTGGTFSITNGGVFGSLMSTPIINPPQSAILGMHAVLERPVVEQGQIVVRPMMYVALSYDHRLIDGRDAVLFLHTIKDLLEDPARLLLQI